MKIQQLVAKAVSLVLSLAAAVYTFPAGNANTVEFFMKHSTHDQVDWYQTSQILEQERQNSERSFGNTHKCPKEVKTGANLLVNEKSTCPWFYKISHDSARYPKDILYANTPCIHCIGSNETLQCHPVKRTIQVLIQQEEISGEIRYEPQDIEISIGFTCGSPNFVDNVAQTTSAAPPPVDSIPWARRK